MQFLTIHTVSFSMIFNKTRLLVLSTVFFSLFFFSQVSADDEADLEAGIVAVEKGEFEKAFARFSALAEAGNAEAQHNLALLYRQGKGVEKDLTASAQWFRKAADQGIADAQYYLGHMYDSGEGIEQSTKYAFIWYRKAAEKGQGLAQINLGVMYANGIGVAQNIEQAYLWFHVAAAQGYKAAFENKQIIEAALEPEKLEELKLKGRSHFQQYVMPFQRHKRAYPELR